MKRLIPAILVVLVGPAKIYYSIAGTVYSEEYWLEGIYYNDIFKYSVAVGNLK